MVAQATTKFGAENVIWDLSALYNSVDDPSIANDMQHANEFADAFVVKYKNQVAELDAEGLLEALQALENLYDVIGRLGSYAGLLYSVNTSDPAVGGLYQQITEFDAQLEQKIVFFDLEWNQVDEQDAEAILNQATLGKYAYHLHARRRYRPYQLSEVEEQLLIEKAVTGRSAWARFFTQLTSAMRFEYDGEELPMPELLAKSHDPDRDVRLKMADSLTAGLTSKAMELTYIFNVIVADKAADDQRRNYETWVSSRNLSNKAPDEVVEALIASVTGNYDLVSRHYNLKRSLLGYDELYDYDRYAPLPIKDSDRLYSWEEAKDIVLNAFRTFDTRLADAAQRFFDENWIHAPAIPDKRGGAFAHPTVPSAHPYIMMNYMGTARDIMTLAHELGHGVHMLLSGEEQGLFGLYTPLTTAEMASVFGEMLVFQDLMDKEPNAEARLAMLAQKIEDTFATVYRQTSMNRFEDGLHTARRTEGELSTERISEIWLESQRDMFQDSVTMRDDYAIWWSYIPHFLHTPGYVYAYAFGELLVLALFQLYQEQGAAFAPKYLNLLAAGDSDYPDQLLAEVGIELNDPGFWDKGIAAIRELIEQEESLVREVYPEKFS